MALSVVAWRRRAAFEARCSSKLCGMGISSSFSRSKALPKTIWSDELINSITLRLRPVNVSSRRFDSTYCLFVGILDEGVGIVPCGPIISYRVHSGELVR